MPETAAQPSIQCLHRPPCPDATAEDRSAAKPVNRDFLLGYTRLCNGVITFDDGGQLLPSGRIIPHAPRAAA